MTIGGAPITITGANANSPYSGGAQTNTYTVSGLLGAESVTSVSGRASGTNVGTYTDNLYGASGTGLSNYNITYVNRALTIDKANLTVTGAFASSNYSGVGQINTYAVNGLLGTDSVSSLSGRANGTNVGTYNDSLIAASGTGLSNYNITYVNGALTIKPVILYVDTAPEHIYITGANTTRIYNASIQSNEPATVTGLMSGDSLTVSGYGTGRNVGIYADSLVATAGPGTSLSNYIVSYRNGALTISPASVTVSGITAADKVYDGNTNATLSTGSVSKTGVYTGDVVSVNVGALSGRFDTKNVGTGKAVTITGISLGGADAANYQLSGGTGATTTASITPAPLSLTGSNSTQSYNASIQTNGPATVTGLMSGDSLTVSGYGTGRNVGIYADSLVATAGPGTSLSNYIVSYRNGALTISPASVTVSGITAADKVYDGNTNATLSTGSVSKTGVYTGDVVSVNVGSLSGSFADKNAGNAKSVTITGISLGGADAANYQLNGGSNATTKASIIPAPLAITGVITTLTYSDITQVNGAATINGLLNGESVTVSGYGTGRNVGSYKDALIASANAGTNLSNYSVNYSNGALMITPSNGSLVNETGSLILLETAASAAAISSRSSPIISVLVVRQSSTEIGGIVVVYVPKELATSGLGFSFVIPDTLFTLPTEVTTADTTLNNQARATLINGDPLPRWLSFDPKTRLISASAVPDRGFPVEIAITEGKKFVTVVISERASGT